MIADLFLCSASRLIVPGFLLPYRVFSLQTGSPTDYLVKCLLTLPDSSDGSDLGPELLLTVSQTDGYNYISAVLLRYWTPYLWLDRPVWVLWEGSWDLVEQFCIGHKHCRDAVRSQLVVQSWELRLYNDIFSGAQYSFCIIIDLKQQDMPALIY